MFKKSIFVLFIFLFTAVLLLSGCGRKKDVDRLDQISPMPQQIEFRGEKILTPDQIGLQLPTEDHHLYATVRKVMNPIEEKQAAFTIRFLLLEEESGALSKVKNELLNVTHPEQAYAIEPIEEEGRVKGLEAYALTPLGLLYAAHSLEQLIIKAEGEESKLNIPLVSLLDWPDIAKRGQWGWNFLGDLDWMAARKLNVIQMHSNLGFAPDGAPTASFDQVMLDACSRHGIEIIPVVRHLEQLGKTGLFDYHPDVAAVPEPGKPLPTDYRPPVCYSNPKVPKLLAGWMKELVSDPEIDEVNVWFSELPAKCWCPECKDKHPFLLETEAVNKAFELVRREVPDFQMQILLTQASYPHNEMILEALHPEVRVVFYHGQLTYDSSHKPMIDTLLTQFAAEGGWLGVYPQLTNSWRTVFPFTGPHFINARMKEFHNKGVECFCGYVIPQNPYYHFNVVAAAEWGWNVDGRLPYEFGFAYAVQNDIEPPHEYGAWADVIGEVGWKLAGSRSVEGLVFNAGNTIFIDGVIHPGNVLDSLQLITFGKRLYEEFPTREAFRHSMENADKALSMAEQIGNLEMIRESASVFHTLQILNSLLTYKIAMTVPDCTLCITALNQMDLAVEYATRAIHKWGMLKHPVSREEMHYRFRDTVDFGAHLSEMCRQRAAKFGIEDPYPEYRSAQIGEWTSADFKNRSSLSVWCDASEFIAESGNYDVIVRFEEGQSGVDIDAVSLYSGSKENSALVDSDDMDGKLSRFGRYVDYWIKVPNVIIDEASKPFYIKVDITGPSMELPASRRSTSGKIYIRKSWRETGE
jgi:hypothetical protein